MKEIKFDRNNIHGMLMKLSEVIDEAAGIAGELSATVDDEIGPHSVEGFRFNDVLVALESAYNVCVFGDKESK